MASLIPYGDDEDSDEDPLDDKDDPAIANVFFTVRDIECKIGNRVYTFSFSGTVGAARNGVPWRVKI